jgi:hexosaminidase
MTTLLASCFSLLAAPLGAQALIPRPNHFVQAGGQFTFPDTVAIALDSATPRLREIAGILGEALSEHGLPSRVVRATSVDRGIVLRRAPAGTPESYYLEVGTSGVVINAVDDAGMLWGVQTLRQLIQPGERSIRTTTIGDAPRYSWRGSMLDVGRHIFPMAHILKHLDWMSRHKLNVFHWHLTEDQGWRIQIDALPRLTEVGGWRIEDGERYGGFYTKADIRRVVERARILGITVVPEIELPGHSRAAIAAYPHLGCTGDTLPVPSTWGVFADVLCPGKESTFTFIETVLGEVLELFPSKYIHIGGDEVPKDRWKSCASCQEIIRRENLGDEHGLQRWMIARVGRWLRERGRTLVGWDEIMDGGLPEGATVQAWQGSERITAAIAAGADVIASPQEWVYLNRQASELPLDRVVTFDPATYTNPSPLAGGAARPTGQPVGRLLGGEAPLWTEHVTSGTNAELMWWPRLIGFAEAMWSGPADTLEFRERVRLGSARLAAEGVAVGLADRALFTLSFAFTNANGFFTQRSSPLTGMEFTERTLIGSPSVELTNLYGIKTRYAARFRGEQIGESRTVTMHRHAGIGRPVRLITPTDSRYPGTGAHTLVDGARGTTFNDGLWNGWWGPDLDAAIDLGQVQPVSSVALSLLEQVNSWIVYPDTVELYRSDDGSHWELVQQKSLNRPIQADASSRDLVAFDLPGGFQTRWVRVIAKGGKRLPAWHSGAGQPTWIFADEIVVN